MVVTYAQVKRIPGRPAEVKLQPTAPEGWDDSEERELEVLARGAGELVRKSLQQVNREQAEACRKKLLQEMKDAGK